MLRGSRSSRSRRMAACERVGKTAVHCMDRTREAFTLVVNREVRRETKENQAEMLPGLMATKWKYWCIATNEDVKTGREDEGLTPAQVEERFNDHCNVENRIKQVKSDAGLGRLPTRCERCQESRHRPRLAR